MENAGLEGGALAALPQENEMDSKLYVTSLLVMSELEGKRLPLRSFDKEVGLFVGPEKASVYIRKFSSLKHGMLGWNWAAFFAAPFWLLYRRMYRLFFAYFGVLLLAGAVLHLVLGLGLSLFSSDTLPVACYDVLFFGMLLPAVLGDYCYMEHARKLYDEMPTKKAFVRCGGTDARAVIAFSIILVIAAAVVFGSALYAVGSGAAPATGPVMSL